MESKPETETIRRVHFDGHYLEVGEYADSPEYAELRVVGEKNIDYFGAINLMLAPEVARQLGLALIAVAGEIAAKK